MVTVYRNFDNEMKTNRWFAQYETGSDRFGQQVSRIEFQGFDSLKGGGGRVGAGHWVRAAVLD
jgi:hypothetical protein